MVQEYSDPMPPQEELLQCLFKIDSLIELILIKDLAVLPTSKLYNCLLVVKNFTSQAIEINEKLLPPVKQLLVAQLPRKQTSLQDNGYDGRVAAGIKISPKPLS